MRWIERQWWKDTLASRLLLPLSWLYRTVVYWRRWLYRHDWLRRTKLPVPVIVVGNITVGGTGKTPCVIWLARHLAETGWRPGVVLRGYGGRAREWPQVVTPGSDPGLVGDEPVVVARNANCPVVADADRVRGARQLLALGCNIVVSDDGLQHYRLARDIEIAVIDGGRGIGNGRLLPAGPLREPLSRLDEVDARLVREGDGKEAWSFTLKPVNFKQVNGSADRALGDFRACSVHAVAGIGYPQRFFALLRQLGADVIEHPFPDHHLFQPQDLQFIPAHDILMTEKDAVKCRRFANDNVWFLAVEAQIDPRFGEWFQQRLKEFRHG